MLGKSGERANADTSTALAYFCLAGCWIARCRGQWGQWTRCEGPAYRAVRSACMGLWCPCWIGSLAVRIGLCGSECRALC